MSFRSIAMCVVSTVILWVTADRSAEAAGRWAKTAPAPANDIWTTLAQTSDGGFIVAGYTYSSGAGSGDAWCMKLDSAGSPIWQKTYGAGPKLRSRATAETRNLKTGRGNAPANTRRTSMKKILATCLLAGATLFPPATSADMGTPNLEGTWSLTIRGLVYDMAAKSKKLLPVSTSATMKITQADDGRLNIEIDGATGVLDQWTPTPDFEGEGLVGNSTLVANMCDASTDFSQSIYGTAEASGSAISGEWWIIDNRTGSGGLAVVQFAGARTTTSDPGVGGCE